MIEWFLRSSSSALDLVNTTPPGASRTAHGGFVISPLLTPQGKSKSRSILSDSMVEEGSISQSMGRSVTVSDVPFKNFFQNNGGNQDQGGKQAVSPPQENFWKDIGKCSAPTADGYEIAQSSQSQFTRNKEIQIANNRSNEAEEENSGMKKRRLQSETNFQKKHEKVVGHAEVVGKGPDDVTLPKHSHRPIAVDNASTGENEDVAESEAEVSSSWLVSQHVDTAKPALSDPSRIGFQGQRQQNYSGNISDVELPKLTYGTPSSLKPITVSMVPYSVPAKPTTAVASIAASYPSPCVVQATLPTNNNHTMVQGTNTDGQQLVFGYSAVQLPTLETNSSWAFSSQPQIHSSTNLGYEKKLAGVGKGNGKHVMETGTSSSSHAEEGKGINSIFRQKEIAKSPIVEGFLHDVSSIKPGVASNLKFGGCGSFPDLPWVSTTGPGPKGKTISGVTYKYSENQIRIVCACHGSHMSPEEFIQHASADPINPENNTSLASFTSSPSGSAQN
ncbi:hypothetical protein BHM03_00003684 [Ensete ventricosum]|nr:hypothetical protein BHM03_00003684 [Ensete ventricosum]